MTDKSFLVKYCLEKIAGKLLPSIHEAMMKDKPDHYVVRVNDKQGGYVITAVEPGFVIGRRIKGQQLVKLPIESLQGKSIIFEHFSELGSSYYVGVTSFFLKGLTGWSAVQLRTQSSWERFRQYVFNQKPLVASDRIAVLRVMVGIDGGGKHPRDAMDVVTALQGSGRWINHPDAVRTERHVGLLLDSWVADKALMEPSLGSYVVLGKAVAELDAAERDENRHLDMLATNKRIGTLTLCLVIVGMLQVCLPWFISE